MLILIAEDDELILKTIEHKLLQIPVIPVRLYVVMELVFRLRD